MRALPNWELTSVADLTAFFARHQAAEQNIAELLNTSIENFQPFHGWDEIWPDQCNHALTTLTSLLGAVKALTQVYEGYVPPSIWSHHYGITFDWFHVSHLIEEELIIVLVSYRSHSQSMEESSLRKRLRLAKKHDEMVSAIRTAIEKFPIWRDEVIKNHADVFGRSASKNSKKSKRQQAAQSFTIIEEEGTAPTAKILLLNPGKEVQDEN